MRGISQTVESMRSNPSNIRYSELHKVCVYFFGAPRTTGGSHAVFKMPWQGDPRVNIQNVRGKAKPYQVKQELMAIRKLEESDG